MANRDIDSLIKAPITGIILSQNAFTGDPVVPLTNYQPGTELCSLADMSSLLFKGTVDEIDVGKLSDGMTAEIQIGALRDTKIDGDVDRVYPQGQKRGQRDPLRHLRSSSMKRPERRSGPAISASGQHPASASASTWPCSPERLVHLRGRQEVRRDPRRREASKKVEIETGLSDGLNIEILNGRQAKETRSSKGRPAEIK